MITAHKLLAIVSIAALAFFTLSVAKIGLVFADGGYSIKHLVFRIEDGTPQVSFDLVNRDVLTKDLYGEMTIRDRITGKEVQVYRGQLVNLSGNREQQLSFRWDKQWRGWGVPKIELKIWENGAENSPVVASSSFILAPSLVTTLGLVSILALGGRGGVLMLSRIV